MDFCVLHTLDVGGSKAHVVRAYVRDVPERTKPAAVTTALDAAGHAFGDAGIPWANHRIVAADKLPASTRPIGTARLSEWTWAELAEAVSKPQMVQVNIRLPRPLTVRLNAAAAAAGVPMRSYVERVLTADLTAAAQSSSATPKASSGGQL